MLAKSPLTPSAESAGPMIKHTIEISKEPVHLSTKLDQLIVQPFDQPKDAARTTPCEDIGVVMVDHPRVSYSHGALQALMRFGAVVVVCGRDHLPVGMLLPLSGHTEVVHRVHDQIQASKPLKKRLWQQLVIAKVKAQAKNLDEKSTGYRRLKTLSREVKSGDTTNVEAQAAKTYWQALRDQDENFQQFKRDPNGGDSVNGMLNYGYAILRAAVARVLVSAGLYPALGIHHHNRSNAFCLADDLLEPFRPLVDRRVRHRIGRGRTELDQMSKAYLLQLLTERVWMDDEAGPLMVSLQRMVGSLVRCLRGEGKRLLIPVSGEILEAAE